MENETQETTQVTETRSETTTETVESGTTPAGAAADLAKVRELVIKANPDVVPDLVRGNSIDELIGSVEPARSAYQAIADRVHAGQSTTVTAEPGATVTAEGNTTVVVQPPTVPAGGGSTVTDPADLRPESKIARAIADRRRK